MKRILTTGLLVSTILAMAAPAAAQRAEGRERGAWTGAQRQQQAADPGQGSRRWSPPARSQQAVPRPAPQQAPSAVQIRPVPASNAAGEWDRQPNRPARANAANPAVNGNRAERPRWSGNAGQATRPAPSTPQAQPRNSATWQQREARRGGNDRDSTRTRNWQGNNRDWRNNDRPGADRDRDWRNNNDRTRDRDNRADNRGQNWNGQSWRGNDRDRGYNYQRRLQDRERWNDQRRWSNSWRNDRLYDWRSYRTQHRSIYRLPAYYAPYGWNRGYTRFSIGIFLNNILFDQSYWISDPYYYRLPPAYGWLRWVRYYDDALLVDIRDGYVVDVIHDFFW